MSPTTSTLAVIYECPDCETRYESPDCETRYLDERRCPDCNLFCRRIGAGGTCPHCDEPVALSELADH